MTLALAAALLAAVGLAILAAVLAARLRRATTTVRRATGLLGGGGEPLAGDPLSRLLRTASEAAAGREEQEDEIRLFEQSLAGLPQGVVLCDADRRVVYRNAVAATFVGARHGDALVERAIEEVLAEAVRGQVAERPVELYGPPRRSLVVTGRPVHLDVAVEGRPAPAGDRRPGDGTTGALAVIEDVSERRRLDAMRRDFVANISHELRTPVGALGLLAETLLAEEDPGVQERLARRMLTEADRVSRTIDDLLTLSRMESEQVPDLEPVGAGLVLAEAVDRIRPSAERREVAVHLREPSDRLLVLGDRRQLVSALTNLLDNAVKYSDAGGVVEASARTDGHLVDLAVRDRGMGIPASDLERVFERFYRVDQARSRQTGGTGLGLAIVRHVAINHRGEVLVESTLGEGSEFTLRIPAAHAGPVPLERAEAS